MARRNPESHKPTVRLMDGQKSLWQAGQRDLPPDHLIEILDLLYATPRIWEAAGLVYDRESDQAWELVYDRVLRKRQATRQRMLGCNERYHGAPHTSSVGASLATGALLLRSTLARSDHHP